jgi:protein TonB
LWAPVAVALAMHAAILAVRPGGVTGSHVAPAAKAMAVRVLQAPAFMEPLGGEPGQRTAVDAGSTPPVPAAAAELRPVAKAERPPVRRVHEAAAGRAPTLVGPLNPAADAIQANAPAAMPSNAATALPAAPDYALGIRLDPGPRPLDDIEPDYPDPYLREGTVVLRLLISETGHVDDVAVVRSEPRGVFEQAALDAFGKARFAPGLAAGTPVKSQITVEVRFVPVNRGGRVSGRTY